MSKFQQQFVHQKPSLPPSIIKPKAIDLEINSQTSPLSTKQNSIIMPTSSLMLFNCSKKCKSKVSNLTKEISYFIRVIHLALRD